MTARKLTPEEWAEIQHVPIKTVWKQIRTGRIRAINYGSKTQPRYRIPESEIDRYDRDNTAA